MKTQVATIGAGPSGLLLARLLRVAGVDAVVLERRSQDYVLARIRAGVLEQGTVDILRAAGVATRLDAEGLIHSGVEVAFAERIGRIDLAAHAGRGATVYGQTELTRDLVDILEASAAPLIYEAWNVTLRGVDSNHPSVRFEKDGAEAVLHCEYIVGCDGFHGISRLSIPNSLLATYERIYPFG
jgi:p-hydroxybenzoate 3-monooxygenase